MRQESTICKSEYRDVLTYGYLGIRCDQSRKTQFAGGVAQATELLPRKHKSLFSNSSTAKRKV
jgi:hypothetical protein